MDHIDSLYHEVIREVQALKLPISKNISDSVVINRRAKSRFGCCKKMRRGLSERYEIELSERLLGCTDKIIKQTLAHEILHTCEGCHNHGERWQYYAQKMNKTYGYGITRTGTAEQLGITEETDKRTDPLKDNYILVCQKCGNQVIRTRMTKVIKHPSSYRCRCGGKLERIK